MIDWNRWRDDYDEMSYEDQLVFYNEVEANHPRQVHFTPKAYQAFFEHIDLKSVTVLEVGGWKGELADRMLEANPQIKRWLNYEISQQARDKTVCMSPKYKCVVPRNFVWTLRLPQAKVFVASHTIEHMRWRELKSLFNNLPASVKYIGLQSPLKDNGGSNWRNYDGSHILEVGWDSIIAYLDLLGFGLISDLSAPEFRAFEK